MIIANEMKTLIMEANSNTRFGNKLNAQRKNLELLKLIEKKCEGLENLLCKNVINTISKKVDSMERNFSYEYVKRNPKIKKYTENTMLKTEKDNINKLNQNIDIIENNFKNNLLSPDTSSSELIRKKIEENYMLLNELEKTNRPIFTKTTEINNSIFVEDKIKEMDDKLGILFKSDNAKIYSAKNVYVNTNQYAENLHRNQKRENNISEYNQVEEETEPLNERINPEIERNKKIKELYEKLDITEKKIKEIAGNILKNF